MLYFWWGCRENLTFITLESDVQRTWILEPVSQCPSPLHGALTNSCCLVIPSLPPPPAFILLTSPLQTCKPGFHGNNCEKPCPQCTGRANGTCDHVSGACPCLPGYSGAECYDDCPLTNYGPRCNGTCSCRRTDICHHVTGACLDVSRGKFSLTFSDAFIELDIPSRRRNLKLGLEALMNTYYDEYAAGNMSTETAPADARMKRSQLTQNSSSDRQHNFMARLLDLRSVALESGGEGSQGVFVLLDGQTVVDGATVMAVLERAPDQIDEFLDAQVYRGEVRPERPTGGSVIKSHLPLIIGSSVGTFNLGIFTLFCQSLSRSAT